VADTIEEGEFRNNLHEIIQLRSDGDDSDIYDNDSEEDTQEPEFIIAEEMWLRAYRVENYCLECGIALVKDQVKAIFDLMHKTLSPAFKDSSDFSGGITSEKKESMSQEATKRVIDLIKYFLCPI